MMAGPSAITGKIAKAEPTKPTQKTSTKSSSGLSSKQKAAIEGLGGLTESLGSLAGLVEKMGASDSSGGVSGNRTDASYVAEGRSGTSNTGKNYINGVLATPEEWAAFLNPSGAGGAAGSGGLSSQSLLESQKQADRKSAYDILMEEFTRYGLGALVEPLKGLVMDNVSPSEFSLRLQQTDAYKKRFSANADRIAKGLTALKPAEYLAMEDSYQNIMRNYGLPASYYSRDSLGTQAGFNQLLANDVSATELEDRVMTAQNRVVNANPEVYKALKSFYPDITNGDILAYTLDPTKALDAIKRKVTAAEIGGAALAAGLTTEAVAAENLARYGITKQQAEQGYQAIGGMLPRASQLADIYKQDPYTQSVAEAEVFGTGGAVSAAERRKKLTALETAKFSGSSGAASNALSRDRAMSQMSYRDPGAGAF